VLIPKLPEFLAANREIELIVSSTDRRVDIVREGFDCVLRIGTLTEPGLTAKRLGALSMINCGPGYLAAPRRAPPTRAAPEPPVTRREPLA
jgi:DNA-binding transcriptional LysR family regulator